MSFHVEKAEGEAAGAFVEAAAAKSRHHAALQRVRSRDEQQPGTGSQGSRQGRE